MTKKTVSDETLAKLNEALNLDTTARVIEKKRPDDIGQAAARRAHRMARDMVQEAVEIQNKGRSRA